jgi:2-desacetyl-2-hydroxyethyl bacteriochlorophyllide A dehydrogenase
MKNNKIIFNKEFNATFIAEDLQTQDLGDNEILLKTEYSLISPGTELAIYRGTESWAPLPFNPGYAAVGRVEAVGKAVESASVGEMILALSPHSEYSIISDNSIFAKVPENCDGKEAAFTRMAAVSITALRVSDIELGDRVAVFGMGLVGNLAAQLFHAAGADVTAVDICEKRLDVAKTCGIRNILNSKEEGAREKLSGFDATVDATGIPAMALEILKAAGKNGEAILLGSPRGEYKADMTELLNQVHLWGNGCVTLKGAHEWRYPKKPVDGVKHNIQRNWEIILKMIADKKLKIEPLITHVFSPNEAQKAYQGLLNEKDSFLGVVFDWKSIS